MQQRDRINGQDHCHSHIVLYEPFSSNFFCKIMSKKSALYNIVHFLFGYVVLYTTPMNLALEQAERELPSNGVFTSVINKGH